MNDPIPDHVCGLCYHPKQDCSRCYRPDCPEKEKQRIENVIRNFLDQPHKPIPVSPAVLARLSEAAQWKCECGERADLTSPEWRRNGTDWEHHHGYPIGHVPAKRCSTNTTS